MAVCTLAGCGDSSAQGGTSTPTVAPASDAGSAADAEDNVVKIGVICSMTGGSAIYGEGAQNAITMAAEEINASDSPYKVEIVNGGKVMDDATDAKQAINAYNSVMAEAPEAVVGCFFSSVTLPIADQASKDGMIQIATGATNLNVTLTGDTIFRNCFIDPYQGKMAAQFVKEKGWTKAAVIYAKDDDYSNGLKDAFIENAEAAGIEIAYVGECTSKDTDFSSQASQAVASGADFLCYSCFLDVCLCWLAQHATQALPAQSWAATLGTVSIPRAWKLSLKTATSPTTTPAKTPHQLLQTLYPNTPKPTAPKA